MNLDERLRTAYRSELDNVRDERAGATFDPQSAAEPRRRLIAVAAVALVVVAGIVGVTRVGSQAGPDVTDTPERGVTLPDVTQPDAVVPTTIEPATSVAPTTAPSTTAAAPTASSTPAPSTSSPVVAPADESNSTAPVSTDSTDDAAQQPPVDTTPPAGDTETDAAPQQPDVATAPAPTATVSPTAPSTPAPASTPTIDATSTTTSNAPTATNPATSTATTIATAPAPTVATTSTSTTTTTAAAPALSVGVANSVCPTGRRAELETATLEYVGDNRGWDRKDDLVDEQDGPYYFMAWEPGYPLPVTVEVVLAEPVRASEIRVAQDPFTPVDGAITIVAAQVTHTIGLAGTDGWRTASLDGVVIDRFTIGRAQAEANIMEVMVCVDPS